MAISKISFTKTPQAGDDCYSWDEESLQLDSSVYNATTGHLTLDVMTNDLGGGAKTLYSIDDGNGNALNPTDLLAADTLINGASGWEPTASGNQARINNGKIEFDLSNELPGGVDSLGANEQFTDTFVYAIRLGNGTLSWAHVHVTITGVNDSATISVVGTEDTAVIEAGGVANGTLGDPDASGTLVVNDVDAGENKFQAPASLDGNYGTFTFNPDSGEWTYILDQSKADKLTDGAPANDTLTVTSYDGTATHDIKINITGSNDNATISVVGTEDTAVVEAGGLANGTAGDPDASGTLVVNDVDAGENKFQTPGGLDGTYGTFTFNADSGAWTYTLHDSKADKLTGGEAAFDTLTVTSFDGTATYDIKIDITGSNDDATIVVDGTEDTAVTEAGGVANGMPGDPDASGTLVVNDVDVGENKLQTPSSLDGTYGTFTFSPDSGEWTYTLDQSKADKLAGGAAATDTLTVTSFDGTATHDLKVDITGANDAPVARDDSYVTDEDVALAANAGGNPAGLLDHLDGAETTDDEDVDGDDLDVAAVKVGATTIVDGGVGDEDGTADGTITFKTSHGLVVLDVETGAFSYASDKDYNGSDSFDYKVTDGTLASDWAAVDITVKAVNDAPTITSNGGGDEDSPSVAENTNFVTTVIATDVDVGTTLKYSIAGGADASLFKIDEMTGDLSFLMAPNLEAFGDADADNVYDVAVKASDGSLSDTQTLHVTVTDVNEQPDAGADLSVKAAENVGDTAVLADVNATDPDVGGGNDLVNNFENLTYSIVAGNGAGLFEIDPGTGEVSLIAGKSLDFEATQQYVLTVRATDGGGLFDETKVTVDVTDVNEAPTLTVDATPVSVAENAAIGTVVGDVDGVDPDTKADTDADLNNDTFNDLKYSITSVDGFTSGAIYGLFSINSATGAVSLAGALDYETDQSYSIVLKVSDGPGLFDQKTLVVNVTDVAEADPNDFDDKTGTNNATQGDDTLVGTTGNDTIGGLQGNDNMYGKAGNDDLNGNNDNDVIFGGSGNDTINGNNGFDQLYGGSGNDTIVGGGENDLIVGGYDADSLQGQGGTDTFVYLSLNDGKDTITDFDIDAPNSTKEGDILDISAVLDLAGNTWTDTQDLTFAVTNGFISLTNSAGATQVNVDIDGAGLAFTSTVLVVLTGVNPATAATDLSDNIVLG